MKSLILASLCLLLTVFAFSQPVAVVKSRSSKPLKTDTIHWHGRVYWIAKLGNQYWFRDNLAIPTSRSRFCNDDPKRYDSIGRFYPFEDIAKGSLCPAGWKIPSKKDWINLLNHYAQQQGYWHKAVGSLRPGTPFNATLGGFFEPKAIGSNFLGFSPAGIHTMYWTSDQDPISLYGTSITIREVFGSTYYSKPVLFREHPGTVMLPCRCMKDLSPAKPPGQEDSWQRFHK